LIEAAMIWNEPNNKSHWDPQIDPDWSKFAEMGKLAARSIRAVNPAVKRVLGGISPIDPAYIQRLAGHGLIEELDVIAVHGFPLDWNLWNINEWPQRLDEIRAVVPNHELWVTEVGVGSFGAEEVQEFGVKRTAELLIGKVPRIFWYSLYDLPQAWGATTRHKEAEGSSYYRHFYMGLLKEDGTPKLGLRAFEPYANRMGLMQWFHFEDPRLDDAVAWLKRLGVRQLRTGLSWADRFRPNALDWFDRQMEALAEFDTTVTFCFMPEHLGIEPHHTSPPRNPQGFADFCAEMIDRYAPARAVPEPALAAAAE
jgi:beta-xylosidase